MSEVTKREPVDNSHRDAGIAAREARKEAEKESNAEEAEEQEPEGEQGESQNEPEESADSEQDDAKAKAAKPKNRGVGKRIDELTKEKYDAQRERDYWREMALKGQAPPGQQPQPSQPAQAAPQETGEPTLESCDFDVVEFNRRWYEWRRNQDRQQEQAQARQRKFAESEAAFRAEHPDYDQVTRNPALPITKAMAEEIAETDNPPAVAYYLGQNPQEAAAIAQMSERAMSRAIGRIEARLSAPPASNQSRQPEPRTVTRAPAPVTTLSGAPAVKKSYDDMSMREYEEQRKKERAAKGLR